jgi:hypothetical protein
MNYKGLLLMLALLVPSLALADGITIGPTWTVVASGMFTGGGGSSESFSLDWTVKLVSFKGFDGVFPEFSGTTTMSGILGSVSETMSNEMLNVAEGYIPFSGSNADAEIDITVGNYYPYGPTPLSFSYAASHPPVIQVPYVYSCFVVDVCAAYGVSTGYGLFSGFGTIHQVASKGKNLKNNPPFGVPEPSTWLLLLAGLSAWALVSIFRRPTIR